MTVEVNGKPKQITVSAFRSMVKEMGGKMSEGDNSVNMNLERSTRIKDWSEGVRGDVEKIFLAAAGDTPNSVTSSIKASRSVEAYWGNRGYDMANSEESRNAAQVSVLAAEAAGNQAGSTGDKINSLEGFLDKYAFSVAAGAPEGGAWAGGKGTKDGLVSNDISSSIISSLRAGSTTEDNPLGSAGNYADARDKFENYWKHYSTLKDNGKITEEDLGEGESQFSVWLTKKLDELI